VKTRLIIVSNPIVIITIKKTIRLRKLLTRFRMASLFSGVWNNRLGGNIA
jgi:hypothetical protein